MRKNLDGHEEQASSKPILPANNRLDQVTEPAECAQEESKAPEEAMADAVATNVGV